MDRKLIPAPFVVTALAVLAAFVFAPRERQHPPEQQWLTYSNREQGYSLRYPADWSLHEEPTRCGSDGFCVQYTTLTDRDLFRVRVSVNFQGGFCESTTEGYSFDVIEASGRKGIEIVCVGADDARFAGYYLIARKFENVNGKLNYLAIGETASPTAMRPDVSELETVVRSFRFND